MGARLNRLPDAWDRCTNSINIVCKVDTEALHETRSKTWIAIKVNSVHVAFRNCIAFWIFEKQICVFKILLSFAERNKWPAHTFDKVLVNKNYLKTRSWNNSKIWSLKKNETWTVVLVAPYRTTLSSSQSWDLHKKKWPGKNFGLVFQPAFPFE